MANAGLFQQIAEAQQRGEPTPMPILPHYQSTAQPADYQVKKQLILFLQQSSDGQY